MPSASQDWVIAIPSYKRKRILKNNTLNFLQKHNIPKEKINVFVANEKEKEVYKEELDPSTYGHLYVAEVGLKNVRNYITAFYQVGSLIFNLDDDVKDFIEYRPEAHRKESSLDDLSSFITSCFEDAIQTGCRLFGLYPVANGYYMSSHARSPTTDLSFIVGCAWGIINPGPVLNITIDDKEDFQRSVIMYLLDGGVLRYGRVAPLTAYFTTRGGMQSHPGFRRHEESSIALASSFSDLAKTRYKASGLVDLVLRDRRKTRVFGARALEQYTPPILMCDDGKKGKDTEASTKPAPC